MVSHHKIRCVLCSATSIFFFFFFNDTATTEIYTLSLHDALPIWYLIGRCARTSMPRVTRRCSTRTTASALLPPRLPATVYTPGVSAPNPPVASIWAAAALPPPPPAPAHSPGTPRAARPPASFPFPG